jgi:hypothetical protein
MPLAWVSLLHLLWYWRLGREARGEVVMIHSRLGQELCSAILSSMTAVSSGIETSRTINL